MLIMPKEANTIINNRSIITALQSEPRGYLYIFLLYELYISFVINIIHLTLRTRINNLFPLEHMNFKVTQSQR